MTNQSSSYSSSIQLWHHTWTAALALQKAIARDLYAYEVLEASSLKTVISRAVLRENERCHRVHKEFVRAKKRNEPQTPLLRGFESGWTLRDQRKWQWLQNPTTPNAPKCRLTPFDLVLGSKLEQPCRQIFSRIQFTTDKAIAIRVVKESKPTSCFLRDQSYA